MKVRRFWNGVGVGGGVNSFGCIGFVWELDFDGRVYGWEGIMKSFLYLRRSLKFVFNIVGSF